MKTFDEVFDSIHADISKTREPDENTRQLIFTLAKIITEENALQSVVDAEGMTYTTTGDKGQHIIKTRPEYTELQRLRDKKRAYIAAIGLTKGETSNSDFT